ERNSSQDEDFETVETGLRYGPNHNRGKADAALSRIRSTMESQEKRLNGLDEACEEFGLWPESGGVSVAVLVGHLRGNWQTGLTIANETNRKLSAIIESKDA